MKEDRTTKTVLTRGGGINKAQDQNGDKSGRTWEETEEEGEGSGMTKMGG